MRHPLLSLALLLCGTRLGLVVAAVLSNDLKEAEGSAAAGRPLPSAEERPDSPSSGWLLPSAEFDDVDGVVPRLAGGHDGSYSWSSRGGLSAALGGARAARS